MTAPAAPVTAPGIYHDLPGLDYFTHPALSASGAKRLLPPSCPALYRHWADNPEPPKKEFDFGHAVHGLVLGRGDPVHVIDAPDWKTKKAQEDRKAAYARGDIPTLTKDWTAAKAMVAALRAHPLAGPLFEPGTGQAEVSLFWHDDEFGIGRRARLDWVKGRLLVDYKTTRSAEPEACSKAMVDYGYHGQLPWYCDAAVACGLVEDPAPLIVWQEKTAPYLVHVTEPDPAALAAGRDRNRRAMDVFARCTAAGRWPGWGEDPMCRSPLTITRLGMPRWAEVQHDAGVAAGDYDTAADQPS